jgi:hypothetical protein
LQQVSTGDNFDVALDADLGVAQKLGLIQLQHGGERRVLVIAGSR